MSVLVSVSMGGPWEESTNTNNPHLVELSNGAIVCRTNGFHQSEPTLGKDTKYIIHLELVCVLMDTPDIPHLHIFYTNYTIFQKRLKT